MCSVVENSLLTSPYSRGEFSIRIFSNFFFVMCEKIISAH